MLEVDRRISTAHHQARDVVDILLRGFIEFCQAPRGLLLIVHVIVVQLACEQGVGNFLRAICYPIVPVEGVISRLLKVRHF